MDHFEEALVFCHKAEYWPKRAWTCNYAADRLRHNSPSDRTKAVSLLDECLAISSELGMCPLQALCHRGLGTLYSQTGQLGPACVELATAIEM